MTNEEIYILSESIEDVDIYSVLVDLYEWLAELKSSNTNNGYQLIETTLDIIYDHCTFMEV